MINIKRELRILSYIALAISTAVVIFLSAGISSEVNSSAIALDKPFDDFPKNEPQMVDFRMDELSFADLTQREKEDQLRDWLLFTIASDRSLSASEINQSLYDLSAVRKGYTRAVSNFEYGTTRSLYIGTGEVVALIPAGLTPEQQLDELGAIADKHRKDTGEKPANLVAFEYELHPEQQYALITRQKAVAAETLYAASNGYAEADVATLADLQKFVDSVDDLTFIQRQGNKLSLGGRKLQGKSYQSIRVEDIAAIWQSEDAVQRGTADFENKWNAKINQAAPTERDQLQVQAQKEFVELGLAGGNGFSLDPTYDYPAIKTIFTQEVVPGLSDYIVRENLPITTAEVQAAEAGLTSNDIVPYLTLVDKLQQSDSPPSQYIGFSLEALSRDYSFQKARYDGPLQGTEVGMLLFYTDLLAKLWALDYNASTPQAALADFAPLPEVMGQLASIYQQEILDLPSTRLWFGPQAKGFQLSATGQRLTFARNATRIYAASSTPLNPGEETYPSAASEAFLGWWDNHYEEVASYEPAYEQLNQIMKWSLLVGWLNSDGHSDLLSFLENVPVQRDFWFPDWVRNQGNRLKFQDWESIQFYPKGYLGNKTEVMPLLASRPYEAFGISDRVISGGVSLADKALFEGRRGLSKIDALDDSVLRSTIDYASLDAADNFINFSTLEGTAYRLFDQQPSLASVAVQANTGHKLRGRMTELANLEFVRSIALTDAGVDVSTSVGGTKLGHLRTARSGNGFKVGWRGSDIDNGQLLVQKLVDSSMQPDGQSLKRLIESEPTLVAAAQVNDGSYLLKTHDANSWMQVAAGGGGRDLPPDWQARMGSLADDLDGENNYLLRWLDDSLVQKQLANGEAELFVTKARAASGLVTPDDFVTNLKQRNYSEVAARIADDPTEAYAIARNHIQSEFKIIDNLSQNRREALALNHLDGLIGIYGRQPDLMVKKALLDISRKRLNVKRLDVDGADWSPVASQEDFFIAINAAFSGSDNTPRFRAIKTDDQVFYIQDSPGLNNIDPSTPIEDALFSGSTARVYRLEPGSIGDSHIGGGGYDDPVAALPFGDIGDEVSGSDVTNNNSFNYRFRGSGSAIANEKCENQTQTGESAQCHRDVYIVVESEQ